MEQASLSLTVMIAAALIASGVALATPTLGGIDGNDMLFGTDTPDTMRGGPGNDTINGLRGEDRIFGATGQDNLSGGVHDDTISGGPHDDVIFAQDISTDRVSCGRGRDTVVTDGKDLIEGIPALKLSSRREHRKALREHTD